MALMKNLYYMIWADAVISFKKYHPKRKDWKSAIFLQMTWIHTINLWILLLWLKFFKVFTIPLLNINAFPGKILNDFFSFTIEFALPIGILNYFLIFHNNKYEKITQKYKNVKFRFALVYSFTIVILALVSVFLYGMLD